MSPSLKAWAAKYRKAIAAFVATLTVQLTALLALGILDGDTAHYVALALVVLAPVGAFFGTKAAKPNEAGSLQLDVCLAFVWAAALFVLAVISPVLFGAFVLVTIALYFAHRGRRREQLAELGRDPFDGPWVHLGYVDESNVFISPVIRPSRSDETITLTGATQ